MTENECLAPPQHWTHEGVCYPGSQATLQLHGLSMGGTTTTSVPEPATGALFALALVLCLLFARIRPRGGTKLVSPPTT